jgi:hypothetical protein
MQLRIGKLQSRRGGNRREMSCFGDDLAQFGGAKFRIGRRIEVIENVFVFFV